MAYATSVSRGKARQAAGGYEGPQQSAESVVELFTVPRDQPLVGTDGGDSGTLAQRIHLDHVQTIEQRCVESAGHDIVEE